MTSSVNKVVFYVMLGFFFIVFFFATTFFYSNSKNTISKGFSVLIASIVFSLFFAGYTQLTGLFKSEGYFLEPGPKMCRGGAYMWQGDSEKSKFCRKLASTPEGAAEIASYQCGKGYTGIPGNKFEDTPMSNDQWRNEMCDKS